MKYLKSLFLLTIEKTNLYPSDTLCIFTEHKIILILSISSIFLCSVDMLSAIQRIFGIFVSEEYIIFCPRCLESVNPN